MLQLARARLSREELELLDVEKQMEEQLVIQHMEACAVSRHPSVCRATRCDPLLTMGCAASGLKKSPLA